MNRRRFLLLVAGAVGSTIAPLGRPAPPPSSSGSPLDILIDNRGCAPPMTYEGCVRVWEGFIDEVFRGGSKTVLLSPQQVRSFQRNGLGDQIITVGRSA